MQNKKILQLFMLLLLVATTATLHSCDGDKNGITVSKDFRRIYFSPPWTNDSVWTVSKTVTTSIADLAAQNGYDLNDIESATLDSVAINIEDTAAANNVTFALVKNATAKISTSSNVFDYNPSTSPQATGIRVVQNTNGIDVMPYLTANDFDVTSTMELKHKMPHHFYLFADLYCKVTFKKKK